MHNFTVYSLTTELDNCGTETRVFSNLAALNAEFEIIILDRIDTPNMEWDAAEQEAIGRIREMLEHDDIEAAWDKFRDFDGDGTPLHNSDDCYWWDEHYIEIPGDGETVPRFFGIFDQQENIVGAGRTDRLAWVNAQARAWRADKNAVVDSENYSVGEVTREQFRYERHR